MNERLDDTAASSDTPLEADAPVEADAPLEADAAVVPRAPRPAPPPAARRYRVRFAKDGALRFCGHLDLQRAFERALRRGKIPVVYSRGYHPRAKVQFGAALPLGCSSEGELLDLWVAVDGPSADELLAALARCAPPGFTPLDATELPCASRALPALVEAAEYRVRFEPPASADDLRERVAKLLAATTLPRRRREKDYDLRPLVEELEVALGPSGETELLLRVSSREGRTGRPEEVLLALGLQPPKARVRRLRLVLAPEPPTVFPIDANVGQDSASEGSNTPLECCESSDSRNPRPA